MIGKTSAGTSAKEEKTVTAGTAQKVVTPSNGKLLSKVTINPTPSQAKTATPTAAQQTIKPDSGKLLSQVLVNAVPDSEKKGLYVWKKSTKKATVTFVQTSHNPITLTASSSDIDLGTVDTNWFVGIKCNYSWATATYAFEFMENDVFVIWTADGASHLYDGTYSYNQATKTITTNINPPGSFGINSSATKQGSFIEFVVADNASAYPDGGTQGGYWYEKVVEGIGLESFGYTKYAVDKFARTDSYPYLKSCPINHSLGEIPRFVYVIANASVTTNARATKLLGTIPTWMQPSDMTYNSAPYVMEYFNVSSSKTVMTYGASGLIVTSEKVTFDNSNYSFATGIEYTLITMA